MAHINTVRCDGPGCENVRRDANHWFRAVEISTSTEKRFLIDAWDAGPLMTADEDKELHLCSEACAVKRMSERIGAGK